MNIKKCWFNKDGGLLHFGEWDFNRTPAMVIPAFKDPETGEITIPERTIPERTGNPLPEGAYSEDREVIENSHGTFLASDYRRLRSHEYPGLADQLDAFWKGGAEADAMRERVLAVKAKYPRPS